MKISSNMFKCKFFLIFIISSLLGCRGNVTRELIKDINTKCSGKNRRCTISLKSEVGFSWDKLYFFNAWTTADSIRRTINVEYGGDDVLDDYKRILFVKGSEVVYEEDYKSFNYNDTTLDFPDMPDSILKTGKSYLTPNESVFIVKSYSKDSLCKKCFDYRLFLIK